MPHSNARRLPSALKAREVAPTVGLRRLPRARRTRRAQRHAKKLRRARCAAQPAARAPARIGAPAAQRQHTGTASARCAHDTLRGRRAAVVRCAHQAPGVPPPPYSFNADAARMNEANASAATLCAAATRAASARRLKRRTSQSCALPTPRARRRWGTAAPPARAAAAAHASTHRTCTGGRTAP